MGKLATDKGANKQFNDTHAWDEVISDSTVSREDVAATHRQKKRKYQFAPLDNLRSKLRTNGNVLKSISVSQVRNTAIAASPTENLTKSFGSIKSTAKDTLKEEISPKKRNIYKVENLNNTNKVILEEVIWKFSPTRKTLPAITHTSSGSGDEMINEEHLPSTPLMPDSLKSVLNFTNMHEKDDIGDQANFKSVQANK